MIMCMCVFVLFDVCLIQFFRFSHRLVNTASALYLRLQTLFLFEINNLIIRFSSLSDDILSWIEVIGQFTPSLLVLLGDDVCGYVCIV